MSGRKSGMLTVSIVFGWHEEVGVHLRIAQERNCTLGQFQHHVGQCLATGPCGMSLVLKHGPFLWCKYSCVLEGRQALPGKCHFIP